MKKLWTLLIALSVTVGLSAQIKETTAEANSLKANFPTHQNISRGAGGSTSVASIDTIWSDDFSDTLNWSYGDTAGDWVLDTILSSNLIGAGFDTKLNSNSGGYFAYIDSDVIGSTGTQDVVLEYTGGVIDCSNYPEVRLTFQTYLRQYQETREVLISNDGGVIWDTIPVLTEFGTSVSSPNGYLAVIDISRIAGGQANIMLKFRYVGGFDWFWAIDDVQISSTPSSELQLNQAFYNGTSDATYTTYYNMVPVRQADSAMINFGAAVRNSGYSDQTNSYVSASVKYDGLEVYADTSDSVLIPAGVDVGFNFQNAFHPSNGIGLYEIEIQVQSDSTDEFPSNNMMTEQFTVSSNQYRRDNGILTNENWFTVNNHWEMLSRYEIYNEDTVVAISVFFPNNPVTGRGVVAGDSVSFYLYTATDLDSAISANTGYIVQPSDVNNWLTLPMPVSTLNKGIYYAGFKVYNDRSSVGTNSDLNASTPPLTVLIRRDNLGSNDPWEYTTSFTPFIRMYTKSDSVCNGVAIMIDDTVYDNATLGAIDITVTGGAPSYNYEWIGPDSFTANTQNISDLVARGMYYVTVTDVFGCAGNDSSLVAGSVTVPEIEMIGSLVLYPNPSNGEVHIKGVNVTPGLYSWSVTTLTGQIVLEKSQYLNKEFDESLNLQQSKKGVYFLTISSKEGLIQVLRFVLN